MSGMQDRPENLGKGVELVLRELADFRGEAAEDRKQAAEDRKQAAEDRREAERDRKQITRALTIIGSEGRKFRKTQESLIQLIRTGFSEQRSILIEIRDALKRGRNGRSAGNGHGARS